MGYGDEKITQPATDDGICCAKGQLSRYAALIPSSHQRLDGICVPAWSWVNQAAHWHCDDESELEGEGEVNR